MVTPACRVDAGYRLRCRAARVDGYVAGLRSVTVAAPGRGGRGNACSAGCRGGGPGADLGGNACLGGADPGRDGCGSVGAAVVWRCSLTAATTQRRVSAVAWSPPGWPLVSWATWSPTWRNTSTACAGGCSATSGAML